MITSAVIKQNLEEVEYRIQRAVGTAGRSRDDVQLVVVSKNKPTDVVLSAMSAGINIFGENYP